MSYQLPMKPSELKSFLKFQGSYNYSLKCFVDIGHFKAVLMLQDKVRNEDVLAKIAVDYNVGEFVHWSHLHHENVIPLLDIVPLSFEKTIFICASFEKTLKTVVGDTSFKYHPKCFDRKKMYAKDVLSGLEYLQEKSLSLMNLDGENILICNQTDKAVISDLSCIVSAKTTTKINCPAVIAYLFPPEADDGGEFECMQFDIWNCGRMFLQMFTMYILPWCQILDIYVLEELTTDLLRQTNPGSNLEDDAANDLRNFLAPFFQKDPKHRVTAKVALASVFLQTSRKRIDEEARDFWKSCETGEFQSDGKFGGFGIIHGKGDISWERKTLNNEKAKMSQNIDLKLKKSKSNSELNTIARQLNMDISARYEATSKNGPNENPYKLNSQRKKTSYSEENLRNFYSWAYKKIPTNEVCYVSKKESEIKSKLELNDESLITLPKTIQDTARNLGSEDSTKCFTEEKYSKTSNFAFDLSCHCIFCTGTFNQENPLKRLQVWPFTDFANVKCHQQSSNPFTQTRYRVLDNWEAQSNATDNDFSGTVTENGRHCMKKHLDGNSIEDSLYTQPNLYLFNVTQGGFLHNSWRADQNNATSKCCPGPIQENLNKQSNEKHLKNLECNNRSEVLPNTIPVDIDWTERYGNHQNKSKMPKKVYPDNSFTSGENMLMFQRCTGFRNGSKLKPQLQYSPSSKSSKLAFEKNEKERKIYGLINFVNSEVHNATKNEGRVKKEKSVAEKRECNANLHGIKPKAGMDKKIKKKYAKIPAEYPLYAKGNDDRNSDRIKLRNKPKQKWTRVLCPGSSNG